jgi:hypothetical protein
MTARAWCMCGPLRRPQQVAKRNVPKRAVFDRRPPFAQADRAAVEQRIEAGPHAPGGMNARSSTRGAATS